MAWPYSPIATYIRARMRPRSAAHRAHVHGCHATGCRESCANANLPFTDGEENHSRNTVYAVSEAVSAAMATGRVSYGCVGPRAAALSFSGMGIPAGAIRTWDGYHADLDVVTQQVSQGIQAYAEAIASGRTAIDDFFSAPVSGFGDGVELRVTLRSGARQVVTLDRWD